MPPAPAAALHVVTEGLLVTGHNPASSGGTAQALLELVRTGTGERLEVGRRSHHARLRASA